MDFDFPLHESVIKHIEIFNKILTGLKAESLFENPNFQLHRDSAGANIIQFTLNNSNEDTAQFELFLESSGIRLDIDHIPELFEWTNEFIEKSEQEFIERIVQILTGYILIEKRRSTRFLQIFDSNGVFVESGSRNNMFHMITGLYIFRQKDFRRLYLPMFFKK